MDKIVQNKRIHFMDGFRGVFALSVAISHIVGSIYGWSSDRPFIGAYMAVNYFFILSGYVLCLTYDSKQSWVDYALLRFFRLWPMLLLGTVSMILVYFYNSLKGGYVSTASVFNPVTIMMNLSFLQGVNLINFSIIDEPSWSIGIEFFLSILLMPILFRISFVYKIIIFVMCYMYFCSYNSFVVSFTGGYSGLLMGILGMTLGTIIFEIKENNFFGENGKNRYIFYPLFLLVIFSVYDQSFNYKDILYIIGFSFLLLMDEDKFGRDWIIRILNSDFVQFLGYISFSLYMMHSVIIVWGMKSAHGNFLSVLSEIIFSLSLSVLCSVFFEHPTYKFFKKLLINKRGK